MMMRPNMQAELARARTWRRGGKRSSYKTSIRWLVFMATHRKAERTYYGERALRDGKRQEDEAFGRHGPYASIYVRRRIREMEANIEDLVTVRKDRLT